MAYRNEYDWVEHVEKISASQGTIRLPSFEMLESFIFTPSQSI